MVRDELEKFLMSTAGAEQSTFSIEEPSSFSFGDYSTNVALVLGKKEGKNPVAVAKNLQEKLSQNKPNYVERIEVAGAGFINFFLGREFLSKNTGEVLTQKDKYGRNELLSGKNVMVEYTDPNPFKEFHIGHLMSNAIGESFSRLVEFSGAEVKRACYQGDVGMHVAKAIWGVLSGEKDFGAAYAKGARAYEENKKTKEEIITLNKKLYSKDDANINGLYNQGRRESLDSFEKIYARLGTKFDFYFFEGESGPIGVEVVKKNTGKVFEESDGAIIYRGEKTGLHTRVFITKDGLPTYEAKELGLAKTKEEKYKSDISVVVTGNEVKDYFKVIRAAMKEIPELALFEKKIIHIPHGMLRLPSGKMSSRTGDVITAESLLNEVEKKLLDKIDPANKELLNAVSVGAVKYSMLKQEAGKDIIFDFEKSLSFTGDSGPYLQYTHARARSVVEKGKEAGISPNTKERGDSTLSIERKLTHFPEVVERSAREYRPHYLCTYLYQLAGEYNTFYNDTRIIDVGDAESPYKLAVSEAVAQTIANGLYLLGIRAPDKM